MLLRTLAVAAFTLLFVAPGNAATRFVATNGTATAICAKSDPCADLTYALTAADPGDTIFCISPVAASAIAITKSITIDCSTARTSIRDAAFTLPPLTAITINIAPGGANPPPTTVRLRGLDVDGNRAFWDRGLDIQSATAVYIEDCTFSHMKQQAIVDHRTGGQTRLYIKDTVISSNGGAGIVAVSAAIGITVLDNVTSMNNTYGIAVGAGNNVVIGRSILSGNSIAGVEGDAGSQVLVEDSKISHNNIGVQSQSSVRVSNNSIAFNNAAFSGPAATMGLNRYSGNVSMGTAPAPFAGAPADVGP